MTNIEKILENAGISGEQKDKIAADVNENYRTVADYERQSKKLERAESDRDEWKEKAETAETTLRGFEGKDLDAMQREIDDWKKKAETAEADYNKKIAEREKADLLKEAFASIEFTSESAKKAIMAQIAEGVSVKNGKLIGFNDLLEEAKKSDASAFVTDAGKPQITSTVINNNNTNNGTMTKKDIDAIKDTRDRQRAIAESLMRNEGIYQKS